MLEVEEHARPGAGIALVHQHVAALQQIAVTLEGELDPRIEEWMPGTAERGERLPLRRDQRLFEGSPLVARQHRHSDADQTIAISYRCGNVRHFIPTRLSLPRLPAQAFEGFAKERFDVMRLKAAGLGTLHVFPDAMDAARIHRIVSKRAFFEQVLDLTAIERVVHRGIESGAHFGLVAVADGLDQQIAKRAALEMKFAEHVEDLAAERLSRLLQLFEQLAIDVAFACLFSHEIPEVTHLRLTNAVDPAEALLESIGIPRQVVVHHQMCALEIDALARGVRREQHLHFRVVFERLLRLHALFAAHAAVDHHHGGFAAEQRGDVLEEIVQRVAMFGEEHELLSRRRCWPRNLTGAIGNGRFTDSARDGGAGEDLVEQTRELAPLGVRAAATNLERQRLQSLQRSDLGLQLGDRTRRGRLVEDFFLGRFDLVVRGILEILDVFVVERRNGGRGNRRGLSAALQHFEFAQPAFQPLSATTQ